MRFVLSLLFFLCFLSLSGYAQVDSDLDSVDDRFDLDDDNDGIPDLEECINTTLPSLNGPLSGFSAYISTADANDPAEPHVLDSILLNGRSYSDFILPDAFQSSYSLNVNNRVNAHQNSVSTFNYNHPNYDNLILPYFQTRDLGQYQNLNGGNDYSDGDYYDLLYNSPIYSNSGVFVAFTEQNGNNPQVVEALDHAGNVIGSPVVVSVSDYEDLGVVLVIGAFVTQNCHMALYPIDDLVPAGTLIYGLRISFGPTATNDGPDAKVFIFGDADVASCDFDGDGVANKLDLDSDNDGIFDLNEAGHTAVDLNDDGVIDGLSSSFGTNGLFNALETSANNGILNYGIADSEAIPDGTFDAYELDADADGCLDTQEAGIADSETDGIAGTGTPTVDANGLVTSITYASPSNSYWQNESYVSAECDTDNDFIHPLIDLDDDNDGIPDLDEGCEASVSFPNADKAYLFQQNPTQVYLVNLANGVSQLVHSLAFSFNGIAINEADGLFWGVNGSGDLISLEPNTFSIVSTFGHYGNLVSAAYDPIQLRFVLYGFSAVHVIDANPASANYGNEVYNFSTSITLPDIVYNSSDGMMYGIETGTTNLIRVDINSQTVSLVGVVTGLPSNWYGAGYSTNNGQMFFSNNTTGGIYLIDLSVGLSATLFSNGPISTANDGAKVLSVDLNNRKICSDSDGDGIYNQLDLDSDNDGIFDLNEAGHAAADANDDGIIDGAPTTFGANGLFDGVETAVDNGTLNYTIADSESAPDGTYDAYELDADGDGCLDTQEAGVADSETDGIAGTGTPTVDANGLVTSITYSSPSNTYWQNEVYVSAACDTDDDFINPTVDLDDDNDGIPDLDECSNYLQLDFDNATSTTLNGASISSITNIFIGDVVLVENLGMLVDGTVVDARIVITAATNGIEYDPGRGIISLTPYNPSLDDHFIFSIELLESGTLTTIPFQGRVIFKDIDSASGQDFTEVVGFSSNFATTIGSNLQALTYQNGGGSMGFSHYGVNPSITGNSGNWTDEGNIAGTLEDHWVTTHFGGNTQINISFGVTGSFGGASGARDLHLSEIFILDNCDADSDGIVNSLDLDSDNDGIFDLNEAGHAAADANDDGIIDGAPTTFGANGLFDGVETAVDNGTLNYSVADSESSSDGRYDAYELDSDNDGCLDTQEAGVADSETDGIAGTGTPTVDANGLVTSITYSSPSTNYWQNEVYVSADCDTDDDFISPRIDLDDDNDGIPDLVECFPSINGLNGFITPESFDITGDASNSPVILNSITINGKEYVDFIVPSSYSSDFSASAPIGSGRIRAYLDGTVVDDYATSADWPNEILTAFQSRNMNHYQYIDIGLDNGVDYFQLEYETPVYVNQNLFVSFSERRGNNSVILEALDADGNPLGPQVTVAESDFVSTGVEIDPSPESLEFAILPLDDLADLGDLIYSIRVYDNHTGSDAADGKVFIFGDPVDNCTDTDGDGVFDYLDLDSDNDGIFDVDEAGHTAADANDDGIIDGAPTTFGANGLFDGVETAVDNGTLNYTIADSESALDGTYDAYELDADGDGCLDTQEAGVADSETDGIAGTGTPTVDANGLVTSITYSSPSNNYWQNEVYVSAACDTDDDFINPTVDLDDDNDGIPDINECSNYLQLDFAAATARLNGSIMYSELALAVGDVITFTGLGTRSDGVVVDGKITVEQFTSGLRYNPYTGTLKIQPFTPTADDYMTVSLELNEAGSSTPISIRGRYIFQDIDSQVSFDYTEIISFSQAHTADLGSALRTQNYQNGGGPSGGFHYGLNPASAGNATNWTDEDNVLEAEQNNWVTINIESGNMLELSFGISGTTGFNSTIRGISLLESYILDVCDTDSDGIANELDLDSDNDGIFDLNEAGHAAADANDDGVIDGAPTTFGANGLFDGVETAVDNGTLNYTIADSESTPDGTYDAYELDSDDDGCFDAREELVPDTDGDGLAGTGIPSVDANGLVTIATYVDPPNNTWQNPADLGACSYDICASSNPFENNTYNIWHTGGGGGLDFNQVQTSGPNIGYPSTFTQTGTSSNLPTREGGATFCHPATGEVLIYSDGEKAWDADGNEFSTSDAQNRFNTLATNLSSSAGTPLIVARPGQCNYADELYIFFTDDHLGAAQELYYVVVDVPSRTISNPTQLSAGRTAEQTNAIQVSCDSTWIVYRNETDLYATLWTSSGFAPPVVTNGIHSTTDQRYRSAFSLDGSKYAATMGGFPSDTSIQKVVVASFNQLTGRFTNPIYLQPFAAIDPGRSPYINYGIAFSPDNSKLYTTVSAHFPRVYITLQYDLTAGNESQVRASMVELGRSDTGMEMRGIVNGPDGRIYIAGVRGTPSDSIHVIDFPNMAGTAANFRKNLIAPGGNLGSGLNNIVYGRGPSACIPSISNVQTGIDPCSILLTIAECYLGSGGPYDVYYDFNGTPSSTLSQNLNGSNQISLTGLTPGIYTDIYVSDNNGCASNQGNIILTCPEVCDNGIDDDGDGEVDCLDDDCASANPVTRVNQN